MYPDFSYLFHDFFGSEIGNWASIIKTFGFFLALAFIVAGIIVSAELKRKEDEGLLKPSKIKIVTGDPPTIKEIITNGLIGFVLGFKIPYVFLNFDEFKADAARTLMSGKGTMIWGLVGAAAFAGYRYWEKKRNQLDKPKITEQTVHPHERTGDLIIAAAISGIVGAKIFAIIEPSYFKQFLQDPIGTFFSGSGLAVLGGLILASIVVGWYAKKMGIPLFHVMDVAAPAIMIAYGIGRQGCHFSGDGDWGVANQLDKPFSWLPDWLWAYHYPRNIAQECESVTFHQEILNEGCNFLETSYLITPVWPTSVYETILAFMLFGILWALRKRIKVAGVLFFIYLMMNGMERFLIEFARINDRYSVLGMQLTQAQMISILMTIIGATAVYYLIKRHKADKPLIY
ncbi:MAG: prolipoprotein diacylglyceryl transferase family protein [Bacteroidota bacterium]